MKLKTKVSAVVAALAFISLAALGYYLYTYDYSKKSTRRTEYLPLEASITLRDTSAGKATVEFSL